MSRVGNSPIIVPAGVKVVVSGGMVMVEGPKGKLSAKINSPLLAIEIKDGQVLLSRKAEDKLTKSAHGTMRAHIMNMVQGAVENTRGQVFSIMDVSRTIVDVVKDPLYVLLVQFPEGLPVTLRCTGQNFLFFKLRHLAHLTGRVCIA